MKIKIFSHLHLQTQGIVSGASTPAFSGLNSKREAQSRRKSRFKEEIPMSCPGEKSGGTSDSSKCKTGGILHDWKRYWHSKHEELSASFMKGIIQGWRKRGYLTEAEFDTLDTMFDNLIAHLQKSEFTDQDAEKATKMIDNINSYIDRTQIEHDIKK